MASPKSQAKSAANSNVGNTRVSQFISTVKAAEILDISPNLLRKLIYDGQIKAIQIGRLIRVDSASLEEFIAQNRFNA